MAQVSAKDIREAERVEDRRVIGDGAKRRF